MGFINDIGRAIGGVASDIGRAIGGVASDVGRAIGGVASDVFSDVFSDAVNLLSGAGTTVSGVFSSALNLFSDAGRAVGDVASDAGRAIGGVASDVGRAIGDVASDVGRAVGDVASDVGKHLYYFVGGTYYASDGNDTIHLVSISLGWGKGIFTKKGDDKVYAGAFDFKVTDTSGKLDIYAASAFANITKSGNGDLNYHGASGTSRLKHIGKTGNISLYNISATVDAYRSGETGNMNAYSVSAAGTFRLNTSKGDLNVNGAAAYLNVERNHNHRYITSRGNLNINGAGAYLVAKSTVRYGNLTGHTINGHGKFTRNGYSSNIDLKVAGINNEIRHDSRYGNTEVIALGASNYIERTGGSTSHSKGDVNVALVGASNTVKHSTKYGDLNVFGAAIRSKISRVGYSGNILIAGIGIGNNISIKMNQGSFVYIGIAGYNTINIKENRLYSTGKLGFNSNIALFGLHNNITQTTKKGNLTVSGGGGHTKVTRNAYRSNLSLLKIAGINNEIRHHSKYGNTEVIALGARNYIERTGPSSYSKGNVNATLVGASNTVKHSTKYGDLNVFGAAIHSKISRVGNIGNVLIAGIGASNNIDIKMNQGSFEYVGIAGSNTIDIKENTLYKASKSGLKSNITLFGLHNNITQTTLYGNLTVSGGGGHTKVTRNAHRSNLSLLKIAGINNEIRHHSKHGNTKVIALGARNYIERTGSSSYSKGNVNATLVGASNTVKHSTKHGDLNVFGAAIHSKISRVGYSGNILIAGIGASNNIDMKMNKGYFNYVGIAGSNTIDIKENTSYSTSTSGFNSNIKLAGLHNKITQTTNYGKLTVSGGGGYTKVTRNAYSSNVDLKVAGVNNELRHHSKYGNTEVIALGARNYIERTGGSNSHSVGNVNATLVGASNTVKHSTKHGDLNVFGAAIRSDINRVGYSGNILIAGIGASNNIDMKMNKGYFNYVGIAGSNTIDIKENTSYSTSTSGFNSNIKLAGLYNDITQTTLYGNLTVSGGGGYTSVTRNAYSSNVDLKVAGVNNELRHHSKYGNTEVIALGARNYIERTGGSNSHSVGNVNATLVGASNTVKHSTKHGDLNVFGAAIRSDINRVGYSGNILIAGIGASNNIDMKMNKGYFNYVGIAGSNTIDIKENTSYSTSTSGFNSNIKLAGLYNDITQTTLYGNLTVSGGGGYTSVTRNAYKSNVSAILVGAANNVTLKTEIGNFNFKGLGLANILKNESRSGFTKVIAAGVGNTLTRIGNGNGDLIMVGGGNNIDWNGNGDLKAKLGGLTINNLNRKGDGRNNLVLLGLVGNIVNIRGNGYTKLSGMGIINIVSKYGNGDTNILLLGGANIFIQKGSGDLSSKMGGGANVIVKQGSGNAKLEMLGIANVIVHMGNGKNNSKMIGSFNILTKFGNGLTTGYMIGSFNIFTHIGDGSSWAVMTGALNIFTKIGGENNDTTSAVMTGIGNVFTHIGHGNTYGIMLGGANVFTKVGNGRTLAMMASVANIFTHIGDGITAAVMVSSANVFTKIGDGFTIAAMLGNGNLFTHVGNSTSMALMASVGNIFTKIGDGTTIAAMIGVGNIFTHVGNGFTGIFSAGFGNIVTKVGDGTTLAMMIATPGSTISGNVFTHIGNGISGTVMIGGLANIFTKVGDGLSVAAMFGGRANIFTHIGNGTSIAFMMFSSANIFTKVGDGLTMGVMQGTANIMTHIGDGITIGFALGTANIITKVGNGELAVGAFGRANIITHISTSKSNTFVLAKGNLNIITKVSSLDDFSVTISPLDGVVSDPIKESDRILARGDINIGSFLNSAKEGISNLVFSTYDGIKNRNGGMLLGAVFGDANIITHIGYGSTNVLAIGTANIITKVGNGKSIVAAIGRANIITLVGDSDSITLGVGDVNIITKIGSGSSLTVAAGKLNVITKIGDGLNIGLMYGRLNINTVVGDGMSIAGQIGDLNLNVKVGNGTNISVLKGKLNLNVQFGDGLGIVAMGGIGNVSIKIGNGDYYGAAFEMGTKASVKSTMKTVLAEIGSTGLMMLGSGTIATIANGEPVSQDNIADVNTDIEEPTNFDGLENMSTSGTGSTNTQSQDSFTRTSQTEQDDQEITKKELTLERDAQENNEKLNLHKNKIDHFKNNIDAADDNDLLSNKNKIIKTIVDNDIAKKEPIKIVFKGVGRFLSKNLREEVVLSDNFKSGDKLWVVFEELNGWLKGIQVQITFDEDNIDFTVMQSKFQLSGGPNFDFDTGGEPRSIAYDDSTVGFGLFIVKVDDKDVNRYIHGTVSVELEQASENEALEIIEAEENYENGDGVRANFENINANIKSHLDQYGEKSNEAFKKSNDLDDINQQINTAKKQKDNKHLQSDEKKAVAINGQSDIESYMSENSQDIENARNHANSNSNLVSSLAGTEISFKTGGKSVSENHEFIVTLDENFKNGDRIWLTFREGSYRKGIQVEISFDENEINFRTIKAKYLRTNSNNINFENRGRSMTVANSNNSSGYGISLHSMNDTVIDEFITSSSIGVSVNILDNIHKIHENIDKDVDNNANDYKTRGSNLYKALKDSNSNPVSSLAGTEISFKTGGKSISENHEFIVTLDENFKNGDRIWLTFSEGYYRKGIQVEISFDENEINFRTIKAKYIRTNSNNINFENLGRSMTVANSNNSSGYGISLHSINGTVINEFITSSGIEIKNNIETDDSYIETDDSYIEESLESSIASMRANQGDKDVLGQLKEYKESVAKQGKNLFNFAKEKFKISKKEKDSLVIDNLPDIQEVDFEGDHLADEGESNTIPLENLSEGEQSNFRSRNKNFLKSIDDNLFNSSSNVFLDDDMQKVMDEYMQDTFFESSKKTSEKFLITEKELHNYIDKQKIEFYNNGNLTNNKKFKYLSDDGTMSREGRIKRYITPDKTIKFSFELKNENRNSSGQPTYTKVTVDKPSNVEIYKNYNGLLERISDIPGVNITQNNGKQEILMPSGHQYIFETKDEKKSLSKVLDNGKAKEVKSQFVKNFGRGLNVKETFSSTNMKMFKNLGINDIFDNALENEIRLENGKSDKFHNGLPMYVASALEKRNIKLKVYEKEEDDESTENKYKEVLHDKTENLNNNQLVVQIIREGEPGNYSYSSANIDDNGSLIGDEIGFNDNVNSLYMAIDYKSNPHEYNIPDSSGDDRKIIANIKADNLDDTKIRIMDLRGKTAVVIDESYNKLASIIMEEYNFGDLKINTTSQVRRAVLATLVQQGLSYIATPAIKVLLSFSPLHIPAGIKTLIAKFVTTGVHSFIGEFVLPNKTFQAAGVKGFALKDNTLGTKFAEGFFGACVAASMCGSIAAVTTAGFAGISRAGNIESETNGAFYNKNVANSYTNFIAGESAASALGTFLKSKLAQSNTLFKISDNDVNNVMKKSFASGYAVGKSIEIPSAKAYSMGEALKTKKAWISFANRFWHRGIAQAMAESSAYGASFATNPLAYDGQYDGGQMDTMTIIRSMGIYSGGSAVFNTAHAVSARITQNIFVLNDKGKVIHLAGFAKDLHKSIKKKKNSQREKWFQTETINKDILYTKKILSNNNPENVNPLDVTKLYHAYENMNYDVVKGITANPWSSKQKKFVNKFKSNFYANARSMGKTIESIYLKSDELKALINSNEQNLNEVAIADARRSLSLSLEEYTDNLYELQNITNEFRNKEKIRDGIEKGNIRLGHFDNFSNLADFLRDSNIDNDYLIKNPYNNDISLYNSEENKASFKLNVPNRLSSINESGYANSLNNSEIMINLEKVMYNEHSDKVIVRKMVEQTEIANTRSITLRLHGNMFTEIDSDGNETRVGIQKDSNTHIENMKLFLKTKYGYDTAESNDFDNKYKLAFKELSNTETISNSERIIAPHLSANNINSKDKIEEWTNITEAEQNTLYFAKEKPEKLKNHDHQIIIQLENDKNVKVNSLNLAYKHPDKTTIVQMDHDGNYKVVHGKELGSIVGDIKVSTIGYGRNLDNGSKTIGGKTYDELSSGIKTISDQLDSNSANIKTVSLVGCNMGINDHIDDTKQFNYGEKLIKKLKTLGIKASVHLRNKYIGVESTGKKLTSNDGLKTSEGGQWFHKDKNHKIIYEYNEEGKLVSSIDSIDGNLLEVNDLNNDDLSKLENSDSKRLVSNKLTSEQINNIDVNKIGDSVKYNKIHDDHPDSVDADKNKISDIKSKINEIGSNKSSRAARRAGFSATMRNLGNPVSTVVDLVIDKVPSVGANIQINVGDGEHTTLYYGTHNIDIKIGSGGHKTAMIGDNNVLISIGDRGNGVYAFGEDNHTVEIGDYTALEGIQVFLGKRNVAFNYGDRNDLIVMMDKSIPIVPFVNPFDGASAIAETLNSIALSNSVEQEELWSFDSAKSFAEDLSTLDITSNVRYDTMFDIGTENDISNRGMIYDIEAGLNNELSGSNNSSSSNGGNTGNNTNQTLKQKGKAKLKRMKSAVIDTSINFTVAGRGSDIILSNGNFSFIFTDNIQSIFDTTIASLFGIFTQGFTSTGAPKNTMTFTPDDLGTQFGNHISSRLASLAEDITFGELIDVKYSSAGSISHEEGKSLDIKNMVSEFFTTIIGEAYQGLIETFQNPQKIINTVVELGSTGVDMIKNGLSALGIPMGDDNDEEEVTEEGVAEEEQTSSEDETSSDNTENQAFGFGGLTMPSFFDILKLPTMIHKIPDLVKDLASSLSSDSSNMEDKFLEFFTDSGYMKDDGDLVVSLGSQNFVWGGHGKDIIALMGVNNNVWAGEGDDVSYLMGEGNTFSGNSGDDTAIMMGQNHMFIGGEGNDFAIASGRYNNLFGGNGNDQLWVFGTRGFILGGKGSDYIVATGNNHDINSGDDDDFVVSMGAGNIVGLGSGDDQAKIFGNKNTLKAGDGDDIIDVSSFKSMIKTGNGDDTIMSRGKSKDNNVYSEHGDDKLYVGGYNNSYYGGDGEDIFIVTKQNILGNIRDIDSDDMIMFNNFSYEDLWFEKSSDNLIVHSDNGNNTDEASKNSQDWFEKFGSLTVDNYFEEGNNAKIVTSVNSDKNGNIIGYEYLNNNTFNKLIEIMATENKTEGEDGFMTGKSDSYKNQIELTWAQRQVDSTTQIV